MQKIYATTNLTSFVYMMISKHTYCNDILTKKGDTDNKPLK